MTAYLPTNTSYFTLSLSSLWLNYHINTSNFQIYITRPWSLWYFRPMCPILYLSLDLCVPRADILYSACPEPSLPSSHHSYSSCAVSVSRQDHHPFSCPRTYVMHFPSISIFHILSNHQGLLVLFWNLSLYLNFLHIQDLPSLSRVKASSLTTKTTLPRAARLS